MSERIYKDSNYRFSEPIRFFKANDPYYFEVDNIPLKQIQENCLWLRDQLRNNSEIQGVKRQNIDELRPYANGEDRTVKVMPGRYTARINDATKRNPLAYLKKVSGILIGDVDVWSTATPNQGNFANNVITDANARLENELEKFKSALSQDSLAMNGLTDRSFTWPVVNADTPVNLTGADYTGNGYSGPSDNVPGGGAQYSPALIQQALLWAKSQNSSASEFALTSFEYTSVNQGFSKLPRTEAYFVKAWRGIARNAIVDVPEELSIEVPQFSTSDFQYIDEDGVEQDVAGVESRIDMVFIYSKPIDADSSEILTPTGRQTISTPTLGIVRGAGIKVRFDETSDYTRQHLVDMGDENRMVASPGDAANENIGFTAGSNNDVAFDVRGSFPAPDDLLNVAPLISERLQDEAMELVGQSILPVAYVWVQNGTQVVLSTDVIDIRPMFRTAELAYNERAGIAAAFPQLSLANPAVGKAHLDYEIKKAHDSLNARVSTIESEAGAGQAMSTVATGYVFGGYFFGPESAMFDFYKIQNGLDNVANNDSDEYIKNYIRTKYGFGNQNINVDIPNYPDWDRAQWCIEQNIDNKGMYCNDYINTFMSQRYNTDPDSTIVGGNMLGAVTAAGENLSGGVPERKRKFDNEGRGEVGQYSSAHFHYISKKIKFNRAQAEWMVDYNIDIDFVNCLPQGYVGDNQWDQNPLTYTGHWVEKGFDEFTIYVAFTGSHPNAVGSSTISRIPAPYTRTNGVQVSARGDSRFSSFAVPVSEMLYSNTNPISNGEGVGYIGNPRIGVCTYPTISWKMTAIPLNDREYYYPNLNTTNPVINIKT